MSQPRSPGSMPGKSTGQYHPSEALPKPIPASQVLTPDHVAYNLALKNFSLAQLLFFYKKFAELGRISDETTVQQVLQDVVLPETAHERCCYSDLILTGAPQMADAMICHWSGTSFRDIVLCAAEFASGILSRSDLEAKTFSGGLGQAALRTHFWLSPLSANHHEDFHPGHFLCQTDKAPQLVRHAGALVVALDPELETLDCARCQIEIWEAVNADKPVHFCGRLAPKFREGIMAGDMKSLKDCRAASQEELEDLMHELQSKTLLGTFSRQVADVASAGVCRLALRHAMADNAESVDLARLLHKGGDPNIALTRCHETALMRAVQRGRTAHVAALLEARADPNTPCAGGWTALHSCAQLGLQTLAERLLAGGGDANAAAHNGRTPIMEAAERKNAELVRVLAASGGDLELRDRDGVCAAKLLAVS